MALCLLPGISSGQQAQTVFRGIVMDLRTDEQMSQVIVTNLSTGQETESGKDGQFAIRASIDDLLSFYYPGYRKDTLLVVDFDLKRVYMTASGESILLESVRIEALTDAQLETEIERTKKEGQFMETSQTRGGIRLSPSRLLGQTGRQARQRYELLLAEKDKRMIDRRFSAKTIQAFTPLEGLDLDLFMIRYRPDKAFILRTSDAGLNLYIMDSYTKFKRLTQSERDSIRPPRKQ